MGWWCVGNMGKVGKVLLQAGGGGHYGKRRVEYRSLSGRRNNLQPVFLIHCPLYSRQLSNPKYKNLILGGKHLNEVLQNLQQKIHSVFQNKPASLGQSCAISKLFQVIVFVFAMRKEMYLRAPQLFL